MNFDFRNPYQTTRIPIFARNVVSTSHPLAVQARQLLSRELGHVGRRADAQRIGTEAAHGQRALHLSSPGAAEAP